MYPGYRKESDGGYSDDKPVKLLSSCGTLDIGVQYSMSERKLQISFHGAKELPSGARSGNRAIQVCVLMCTAAVYVSIEICKE